MADPATPDVPGASSTPIAESPAPTPVQTGDVLERMSAEQRTDWKLTGKIPESLTDAASSPAEPAVQDASTDATTLAPASEPGKPRPNADTRKAQLKAEIESEARRLRETRDARIREEGRLQALKGTQTDDIRAASSPAPADAPPVTRPKPSEDQIGETYDTYADFVEDLTEWKVEQREFQAQTRTQRAAQEQQLSERVEKFRAAVTADPTFATSVTPQVKALVPTSMLPKGQTPNGASELAERFLKSDVGLPLMRHFSDHPEELARFSTQLHPDDFYIEIGKLEATLTGTPAPVQAATPTKTVTSFSAPVTVLGNRPADAGDPMKAALARGDFAAYRDLKNKSEIAAAR